MTRTKQTARSAHSAHTKAHAAHREPIECEREAALKNVASSTLSKVERRTEPRMACTTHARWHKEDEATHDDGQGDDVSKSEEDSDEEKSDEDDQTSESMTRIKQMAFETSCMTEELQRSFALTIQTGATMMQARAAAATSFYMSLSSGRTTTAISKRKTPALKAPVQTIRPKDIILPKHSYNADDVLIVLKATRSGGPRNHQRLCVMRFDGRHAEGAYERAKSSPPVESRLFKRANETKTNQVYEVLAFEETFGTQPRDPIAFVEDAQTTEGRRERIALVMRYTKHDMQSKLSTLDTNDSPWLVLGGDAHRQAGASKMSSFISQAATWAFDEENETLARRWARYYHGKFWCDHTDADAYGVMIECGRVDA